MHNRAANFGAIACRSHATDFKRDKKALFVKRLK
jgi:hypothetical protein